MTFPGTIYDAHGRSLDRTAPDLLQEDLDAFPLRFLATDRDVAPLALVWLLDGR